MNEEHFEDKYLSSLKGMKRAEAPPFLFTKIEGRLSEQSYPILLRSTRWSIATLVLLLLVNIAVLSFANPNENTGRNSNNSYPAIDANFNIY